MPNSEVLLSPLTTQEAVLPFASRAHRPPSAKSCNTKPGLPEEESRRLDIQEILNYRRALREAERELTSRPFNLNLLLRLHAILLDSVRGSDKSLGRIRTMQNWIGAPGSSIEQADFLPPEPSSVMEYLGLLSRPSSYLSSWLEEHRDEYIESLRGLGKTAGAWNRWIKFFLAALDGQARRNASTARDIMALYEGLKHQVIELTHSQFAVPLLDQSAHEPTGSARGQDSRA